MRDLKDYMLLFRMELDPNHRPTSEEASAMKGAWGKCGGIAQDAKLVSAHQLGFEGATIGANQTIDTTYVTQEQQSISGNLIVKAKDLEEATDIAKGCLILHMGGSVEVRNTLMNH